MIYDWALQQCSGTALPVISITHEDCSRVRRRLCVCLSVCLFFHTVS